MTRPARISPAALLAAALLAAAPGLAAPTPPAPTPDAGDAPLRGPTVQPAPAPRTLVQRDLAGKLIPLDTHPAEAAVRLLDLDPATRAKVDAILLERSRLLDALVTENFELLVRLNAARESGRHEEAARLFRELSAKARPLRDRGPLARELMAVLSPEQAAELRRLIQEYWQAAVKEELEAKHAAAAGENPDDHTPVDDPAPADLRAAARDEMHAIVRGEIRRAYERTIASAAREFDELIKDLRLTPEQESQVRKIVGDSFQRTYGKATQAERIQVFWQVYSLLDDDQKAELLRRLGHPAQPQR